jgi:hypothetical protein
MKIAFIHYHLKTGGVATVLKQQLSAVAPPNEALVLTGDPAKTRLDCDIVHLPELGYSTKRKNTRNAAEIARQILKAIRDRFGGPSDVLHIHNPTLAKNWQFLEIIKSLKNEGANLLLQIHDLAEDGRPQAYFEDEYPADCHYGVINQRDYKILLEAGLKKQGLHLMENAVKASSAVRQARSANSTVLYPIRAIRRKNIGEAILLSLFFKPGRRLAITLPPNSLQDIASYRSWKAFVRAKDLSVSFDQGLYGEFADLMASAEFVITTSISEGFGFSFLEPWLFGKLLWGRKIDDICRYFEFNGIQLDHLYSGLYVPVDWLDLPRLRERWSACALKTYALFNYPVDQPRIQRAFERITQNGIIDFGLLDESFQKLAISRLLADGASMNKLMQLNSYLVQPGTVENTDEVIAANRDAVMRHYSPQAYRTKLMHTYRLISMTRVSQKIDKDVLTSFFLKPESFSLLKWSRYIQKCNAL